MKIRKTLGIVLFFALTIIGTAVAAEPEHPLTMWQVDGQDNRIYILGSIHLLRAKDHPLPSAIFTAYDDADTLIMELDMDDMDPVETQTLVVELGLIQGDKTLSDMLGAKLYAEAETLAAAVNIPLSMMSRAEPWYAAMNVELMLLMRIGFNPMFGIETHMMERAKEDGKEILGLETMRQQLGFLDGLSPDAQKEMLMQALSDGDDLDEMMGAMIDAWRRGDTAYMEETLLSDMQDYVELYKVIIVDRNIDWTGQIEELLDDQSDYMIIVGALHLIGDQGVPRLLAERGHSVTQMHQAGPD